MKKYRVCANVSFYTEVVIKAEDKQAAYETVEGVMSFEDLLLGRKSEAFDEVDDITVERVKKNGW